MNDKVFGRYKFAGMVFFFGIVFFATIASATLGYHEGMQTPISELYPEVSLEEVAFIRAVIYGVEAGGIGMVGLLAYVLISFLFESRIKSRKRLNDHL